MTFYLLLSFFILTIATLSFIVTNTCSITYKHPINNYLVFILFFTLILICSFRINSGFDYISYLEIFTGVNNLKIEPLYSLIQFFTRLTESFSFHLLVISTLAVSTKIIFFYKSNLGNICYALFLYFLLLFLNADMGVLRQGVSIGFIALSAIYYNENKHIKAFAFISIASLFHISAIIFYPVFYLLRKIKVYNAKNILIYLLISFALMYFFISLSPPLKLFILNNGGKYSTYALNNDSAGLTLGILLKSLMLFVFYKFLLKNKYHTNLDIVIFKLYLVGICIFLVFNFFPIVSSRTGNYFKIFEIVLFCRLIFISKTTLSKIVFLFVSMIWAYAQFFQFLLMDVTKKYYIPYDNLLYHIW